MHEDNLPKIKVLFVCSFWEVGWDWGGDICPLSCRLKLDSHLLKISIPDAQKSVTSTFQLYISDCSFLLLIGFLPSTFTFIYFSPLRAAFRAHISFPHTFFSLKPLTLFDVFLFSLSFPLLGFTLITLVTLSLPPDIFSPLQLQKQYCFCYHEIPYISNNKAKKV